MTHCKSEPRLEDPIPDPARFPWREVRKVDHYCLSVGALVQPMEVREEQPRSGGEEGGEGDA